MADVVEVAVDATFVCKATSLDGLIDMAKRVDEIVGATPPEAGYGLAEAVSAIFNGGTSDNIQVALGALAWNFKPRDRWSP